ncbi:MAG: hypothetical protein OSJ58_02175 [Dysosmobacter sp.]|nr:hypothetical protein [Dysosmobacter sp.]
MSVFSPAMLVSVLVGCWFLMWSRVANLVSYNAEYNAALTFKDMGAVFLDDIATSHSLSGYDLFAPILAVLPAAAVFCDDYNSGYIKAILSRTTKHRYIKETLLCSSIAGGLAIFLPCFLSGMFYLANGKLDTLENVNTWGYSTSFDETVYAGMQYIGGGLLLALMLMVLAFMFGAIWSNVGLLVSVLFPNKYLALAAPFALYFSIHLIFYRIGFLLVLSPVNMLMPNTTFIPFAAYPLLYEVLLLGMTCILFSGLAKRRLWDV